MAIKQPAFALQARLLSSFQSGSAAPGATVNSEWSGDMHPVEAQTTELDSDSKIVIRAYKEDDMERVRAILLAGGWQAQSADMIRFSELVARSQLALVAVRRGEVTGFVRALTDGISNGYISMLAVAPEHRGAGIGASLVLACWGTILI